MRPKTRRIIREVECIQHIYLFTAGKNIVAPGVSREIEKNSSQYLYARFPLPAQTVDATPV